MDHSSPFPSFFGVKSHWRIQESGVWTSAHLHLERNIAPFPFPACCDDLQRAQIFSTLSSLLLQLPTLDQPTLMHGENLKPGQKELLLEHFMIDENMQHLSMGQGFVVDERGDFLAEINIDNHLTLCCVNHGVSLLDSYQRLQHLDEELSARLPYSFDAKFGYLTQKTTHAGTGLLVKCYLHLPALIHTKRLFEVLDELDEETVFYDLSGDRDFFADIIVLENRYRLGVTEEQIVCQIEGAIAHLIGQEEAARKAFAMPSGNSGHDELKDRISRAYGLITHSHKLDAKECLSALSLIELGRSLGWIENAQMFDFANMFVRSRRAHLLHVHGLEKAADLEQVRAKYLHEQVKGLRLAI